MSKMCLLLFQGKKKKQPNQPNLEPINVCKQSVKTCLNKCSCQTLQPGLLLDVLLPTTPQEGTLPLPSPRASGEKAAAPSPCVLPAGPSLGASHALNLLPGARGQVCPAGTREGPAPGARAALELPSTLPGAAPTDPGVTWDHPHSGCESIFPTPVPVPGPFQQCSGCSHYHPRECCNFLYFQFLNYIDYHIKHSWCYRNRLKIISLYLPNTNETHLYY